MKERHTRCQYNEEGVITEILISFHPEDTITDKIAYLKWVTEVRLRDIVDPLSPRIRYDVDSSVSTTDTGPNRSFREVD